MIEIAERITRVTTSNNSHSALRAGGAAGVRVTLEFSRSVPLSAGQEVRWRYDSTGNGHFLDCVGIPHPTHIVARRGHLVVFHYRLSHWITKRGTQLSISTATLPAPIAEAPAVDQTPA